MSKKNRKKIKIPNDKKHSIRGKTIADCAFIAEYEQNTDNTAPTFSFKSCDENQFTLSKWQPKEIEQLISTLKRLEHCTWQQIKNNKGFGYKKVDPDTLNYALPEYISPDETIIELRVSKRARLFGYRSRNIYHIIWFDRNHDVYDMS
jgi:hypothetical protein